MLLPLRSVPNLKQVDSDIFTQRYFGHCMQCTFCNDWCCQWGCDVNLGERDAILAVKDALQPFVPTPADKWFGDEIFSDPEYPTGRFVRANRVKGACVFLSPSGRGCAIHSYALAKGRDYHSIKPMVCWLFPVCWDQGVLRPSTEVREDLVCKGNGPSLYAMVRDELRHVFGEALIAELDLLASGPLSVPGSAPIVDRAGGR